MRSFATLSITAALILGSHLMGSEQDDMAVPLGRSDKVGRQRNLFLEAEYSQKTIFTSGGEEPHSEEESWKSTVEMKLTTDEVDARGEATELTLVIKNFTLIENDHTSEPLKQGATVKASIVNGKKKFSSDGEPVGNDAQKALERMVDMANEGKGNELVAFGLDKPRKPGEKWETDAKELISIMPEDSPFLLKEEGVKGKMEFVEITGEGEKRLAIVQGEVELPVVGLRDAPAGFKMEGSSIRMAFHGQLPLDTTRQAAREAMTMILDFEGGFPGPDGKRATMKISGRHILKVREVP